MRAIAGAKKLSPPDLSNHRGSANIRSALNTRHTNLLMESSQAESPKQATGNTVHCSSAKGFEEGKSHKDGSLWGDSDDDTSRVSELDREWKNRRQQFYTHGYREGISAGQIDSAQEGFNGGFKDSVLVGYNWGLVRGVTSIKCSALSYLPEEVRKKMVETEANIMELKSLHESALSISTEAALKLFYDDWNRKKASSETGNFDSDIQQIGNQVSDSNALVDHFRKLRLLLKEDTKMMIFNSQ